MKRRPDDLMVFKIGGNDAEDPDYLEAFAKALQSVHAPKIVVHGGGKTITQMQESLGQASIFIDGQRFTDESALVVAEMVLCGTANKRLVRALVANGNNALGISGMDAGILRCKPAAKHLGLVGEPTLVNTKALCALIDAGFTPVISPLGLLDDGQHVNVNADLAAAAIAKEMTAGQLVFLTNVPGIKIHGHVAPLLEASEVRTAIEEGAISGGMIPKVNAALSAAELGMPVRICNLDGMHRGGTTIYAEEFTLDHKYSRA